MRFTTLNHPSPEMVSHLQVQQLDYCCLCHSPDKTCGSFYDFIPREAGRLIASLGHLPPAGGSPAITTSSLRALVRNLAAGSHAGIQDALFELNRTLYLLCGEDLGASLFLASIDPVNSGLQYVNAGADPPLLIRRQSRTLLRLEQTGPLLGLSRRIAYYRSSAGVEPGDALVAFSEGVAGTRDNRNRALPDAVVLAIVLQNPDAGAAELTQLLLAEAGRFTGRGRKRYDRAIMVVRFPEPLQRVKAAEVYQELAMTAV